MIILVIFIFHMADLTTLIVMLSNHVSSADDAACNTDGSCNSNTEGDAEGAAVAIARGGGSHPIAVELVITNPGGVDGGFARGGAYVPRLPILMGCATATQREKPMVIVATTTTTAKAVAAVVTTTTAAGTDNNQLKVVKATATVTETAGSSRDMTMAVTEGSHMEARQRQQRRKRQQ